MVALGGTSALDAARVAAVAAMANMGSELAGYINTLVVAKGVKYVLVRNLRNPNYNPYGRSLDAQTQAFRATMNQAFNRERKAGLSDPSGALPHGVIIYDNYAQSEAIEADPAKFGFSNTTSPACGPNAFGGNAIICNSSNLVPGDTSRYAYADMVHASPYAHRLDAEYAMSLMVAAGWQ